MDGFRLSTLVFLLAFATISFGCGSPVSTSKKAAPPFEGVGGGSGGSTEPEADADPTEAAGFFMNVTAGSGNVTLHRANVNYTSAGSRVDADTSNFETECRILPGALATDTDILCIAEMEELDLHFNDITIQYHVPPSMCSYMTFKPYYFYGLEPGNGPTVAAHEINPTTIDDITNTRGGVPYCEYDYTAISGPNCCEGSYDHTITDNTATPATVKTTNKLWGGKKENCLVGPAMTSEWPFKSANNIPLNRLEYVEGVGFNNSFKVTSAVKSDFNGFIPRSNVWAANFYNPTDHVGGPGTVPAGHDVNRPPGLRIPNGGGYYPEDTYVTTCFDRSREIKARIRLMIRDWNSAPIAEGGDPDALGTDPDFPDSSLNDHDDWLDFGTTYSASST